MYRTGGIAALFFVLCGSGCAIPLGANITDVEGGDSIVGASCTVVAAPVTGLPTFESGGYSVDRKDWNEEFATELAAELKDAGAAVDEGDPVEIGVVSFHYRNHPETSAMEMTLEIEATYRDYKATHKGFYSDDSIINSSSTQTLWTAAGAALSSLLKDPAFVAALKGS